MPGLKFRSLTRTARAAGVLPTTAALAALGFAAPAQAATPPLPHLNITGDYVTGISSGGFMATQLQGAGIFASGPYDCGQGNLVNSWVTPDGPLLCGTTLPPCLSNCFDDPEGEMLSSWLGNVNPRNTGAPQGTLLHFDQDAYVPGGWGPALSMDDTSR